MNDNLPVLVRPSLGNLSVSLTLTPSLHLTSTHSTTHHHPLFLQNHPPWFHSEILIQQHTVHSSHKQQSLRHRIVSVVFIQPPHGHRFPQQSLRITLQYLASPSGSGSHFAYHLASSLLYQIILVVYLKWAPKRKPESSWKSSIDDYPHLQGSFQILKAYSLYSQSWTRESTADGPNGAYREAQ